MDGISALWALHSEMAPWLLLGFAVAGAMGQLIHPDWWLKHLGKSDWLTHLKAVLVGIPLPLCSCSVIPTAIGLRKNGASRSATVAFLTATPQTGVDSIAVTVGVLGWPFAVVKVISALVMGCLSGFLTAKLVKDERSELEVSVTSEHCPSFKSGFKQAFVTIPGSLARPYLLGTIISVAMTMILPPQSFAGMNLGPLGEMILAMIISLPMYVCATSSVPIALLLLHQGLGYGAVLVFLMAGPASNLSTMLVIAKELGWQTFWIYFSVLLLGCFVVGYGLDGALAPIETLALLSEHAHEFWGKDVAGALLLLILLPHVLPKKTPKMSSCCSSGGCH